MSPLGNTKKMNQCLWQEETGMGIDREENWHLLNALIHLILVIPFSLHSALRFLLYKWETETQWSWTTRKLSKVIEVRYRCFVEPGSTEAQGWRKSRVVIHLEPNFESKWPSFPLQCSIFGEGQSLKRECHVQCHLLVDYFGFIWILSKSIWFYDIF